MGRHVVIMQDSKFDDKQRHIGMELFKSVLYSPYHAALVAGQRTRGYLRFLGFRDDRIFVGYDTISIERVRRMAESEPAPGACHTPSAISPHRRFIAKKNITLALRRLYGLCRRRPFARRLPRALHLCGSGNPNQAAPQARLSSSAVQKFGYLNEEDRAGAGLVPSAHPASIER